MPTFKYSFKFNNLIILLQFYEQNMTPNTHHIKA